MLRLFAFDLDGTLLVDRKIGGRNLEALRALQEAGIQIALVSGRIIQSPLYLAGEAGLSLHCIGSNGAIAAEPDGTILFERRVPKVSARKLVDIGLKIPAYFHFYSSDSLYSSLFSPFNVNHLASEDLPYGQHMQCNVQVLQPPILRNEAYRMLKIQYVLSDRKDLLEPVEKALSEIDGISVTMSGDGLLEAMAKGVDKWQGLSALAQTLGISPDSICAMGDYRNDLEMIENAGIGVAMGNAPNDVKDRADLVTSRYSDYGVADAIRTLKERKEWE